MYEATPGLHGLAGKPHRANTSPPVDTTARDGLANCGVAAAAAAASGFASVGVDSSEPFDGALPLQGWVLLFLVPTATQQCATAGSHLPGRPRETSFPCWYQQHEVSKQ